MDISMKKKPSSGERASSQSAAEFFSEHQQIAGFDNPGKSLFTTIRELVENSLDAAESIHTFPVVQVTITEYTEEEHNKRHGINTGKSSSKSALINDDEYGDNPDARVDAKAKGQLGRSSSTSSSTSKESMYYDIQCRDNGCGIAADEIGELLGKVLSGSKHGIRQTRGKFGLGAKMALIWSKKSSGLPIQIRSAHCTDPAGEADSVDIVVLDMDIQRNQPKILSRRRCTPSQAAREEGKEEAGGPWSRGLDMRITIGGSWSSCRSRVLQYFQQLAVITPYAQLSLVFESLKDPKKNFNADFVRRSEQMPPIAATVLPHAKSLNNITLLHLLRDFASSSSARTMDKFLTTAIAGLLPKTAAAITSSLGIGSVSPDKLGASQVAALCQVLRDDPTIRPPSPQCLSPAGEYNLRLGVLKELKPRLVATFTDKPGVHEGHAFLVEAAVSLGGSNIREGINIFRFANRIPLLFETGADVVTQVATRRIKWTSYLIDPKRDSIGVYVSIVSTRIPFKGTSKEYIGDDVLEIQHSVKRALLGCCQQLRVHLAESQAKREVHERRKALLRYIPDISKSLLTVAQKVCDKADATGERSRWTAIFSSLEQESTGGSAATQATAKISKRKQSVLGVVEEEEGADKRLRTLSESRLVTKMTETAHKVSNAAAGMDEAGGCAEDGSGPSDKKKATVSSGRSSGQSLQELYLTQRRIISSAPLDNIISVSLSSKQHASSDSSLQHGRWILLSGVKMGAILINEL